MAFRITQKPRFAAPVSVPIANDKGGFDKNTFTAFFKRPTLDELAELRALANDELVRRQLDGWEMQDEDTKEAVPFSAEAMEAVLQIPPSSHHIALAFWEGVNGARAKN